MHPATVIDLNWMGRPQSIACALLRAEGSIVLVDPGPASSVSTLRQELAALGIQVSDVNAILLTHIHLDHAGATGTLVRENPRLRVYVHEKGAPHMIAPEKLLSSAVRLYGDSMQKLFGEFLPVPEANLQPLRGGEVLLAGGRNLHVLYTPGHASHHVTYFDPEEGTAFVGDTGGICINGNRFILPATPPPDISVELWDASLDAIASLRPRRLFLTHFAFSDRPAEHIEHYRQRLHHWSLRCASILAMGIDQDGCIRKFTDEIAEEAANYLQPSELEHYVFTGSVSLSWMGLARYHKKRAEKEAASSTR